MENIIEELRHLIAEKLDSNIRLEEIDPDAPLLGEWSKLDSLAIVELITLSEENFGIEFGEDDLTMEAFANLRTLAGVIAARRVPAGA
jgi:acyl carrier protein